MCLLSGRDQIVFENSNCFQDSSVMFCTVVGLVIGKACATEFGALLPLKEPNAASPIVQNPPSKSDSDIRTANQAGMPVVVAFKSHKSGTRRLMELGNDARNSPGFKLSARAASEGP